MLLHRFPKRQARQSEWWPGLRPLPADYDIVSGLKYGSAAWTFAKAGDFTYVGGSNCAGVGKASRFTRFEGPGPFA